MFYLLGITILMSLAIYVGTAFYISNRSGYDRREENVELFKKEKENLKLNKSLPQEYLSLLVNEREQILLQDVPEEKELVVLTKKDSLFRPLFFSVFSFIAICGIYFQPLSMGSLKDLQTYQSINGFIEADFESRKETRGSVIQELKGFMNKTETRASEIYLLANRFKDINEFLITSLLLKSLIDKHSDEIPLGIYAEYAQILFFRDNRVFSKDVEIALELALKKSPVDPIALTLEGVKNFQAGEIDLAMISWEKAKENTNDGNEKLTIQEAINAIKSMKNQ